MVDCMILENLVRLTILSPPLRQTNLLRTWNVEQGLRCTAHIAIIDTINSHLIARLIPLRPQMLIILITQIFLTINSLAQSEDLRFLRQNRRSHSQRIASFKRLNLNGIGH